MTTLLRVDDLHKAYAGVDVLRGVSLTVTQEETVVVLGSSGSGKSTFLRLINFLEIPTSGKIYFQGELVGAPSQSDPERMTYRERELTALRARIGMVFQHFNLFPHMTVEQNVMLGPMKVRGFSKAKAKQCALENLERVGIAGFAKAYPHRLSGGQQQRVAIARALAMEPILMLFDEATSALDPELVGEVLSVMRQLSSDGMTMIIVTHELGFAYNVADRIVFLHQGQIHEEGSPDEILRSPKMQRTQEFLRSHTAFQMPASK